MKSVLFNIHDVALIVTVAACALLGLRHISSWRRPKQSEYLFGLFLATNALVAINTLILWAEPVRHPVFAVLPYLYLFLGAAGFMLGPLLFWQLRAHMNPEFRVGSRQCIHLLPTLLALIYLYLECFRFPHIVQRDLLLNLQIYHQSNTFYGDFITLQKLLPIMYGIVCFGQIKRHSETSDRGAIDEEKTRDQIYIIGGFTAVWLWTAITHFYGTLRPGGVSDAMGILGNYFNLALIVLLIYRQSPNSSQPPYSCASVDYESKVHLDDRQVARITSAMTKDKAFLNPQLTLERLANRVQCSPREVSLIINRRFGQNFHEFVSSYRLEEVKRNLRSPQYSEWTISDLAQAAGFNSKATFHRFFKKSEGTTPSLYRQRHQATANALPSSSNPRSSQTV